jgi:general secretion pathway protein F/type IV pilus assembly protein PilC
MPLFQYQAIEPSGKKKKGFIEAHGEQEARDILREQGVMLVQLALKTGSSSAKHLKGDHLLTFTMQMSQLVSSGIPLYESLLTLEEQYRDYAFHPIILSLCEQIKAGSSLSEALAQYPESFDKLYRSMIAAGESVGALHIVFDRLCHLLTKRMRLQKQLATAMIYPAILGSFSLLIVGLLLGFVVPSLENIFADRPLNGFTKAVLQASHIVQDYWWILLPAFGGMIALIIYQLNTEKGKLWWQRNSLKIPVLKTLVIQTAVARFCRTLGTLQEGGLNIVDSLRNAREVMHNVVLEEEVKKAELKIIEGSSLSRELKRSLYFPTIIPSMLSVGEESGSSTLMLNKLANMYEDELEKTLDRVVALAQPVILIFMGTVIGTILMAILLPLTDVSSLTF